MNFFPTYTQTINNLAEVLTPLQALPQEAIERLRSAARGGAKTDLGLVMGHHPEMKICRVTKCMPVKYDNGKKIVPKEVFKSVSGYASHVADMVDLSMFFHRVELHARPADASDDEYLEQTAASDEDSDAEAEGESEAEATQSPA